MLPATVIEDLAYAEVYSDPPGLTPLPEEEPLIAKSVAKRRNEFITVRHCARIALGELGVPAAPILKGDKGEPCWPDGIVGSLTHCTGYRGEVVGRTGAVRSVGIDAEPHDVLPHGVLDSISLPAERSDFPTGYCNGWEFWLLDQTSDYYRRHLMLHEGTHGFMITQLGGAPNFDPEGLAMRSHAEYKEGTSLINMIEEDLVAERIAIDSYREIVQYLGDRDPTSRRLMEEVLAKEEEHADDLVRLLTRMRA